MFTRVNILNIVRDHFNTLKRLNPKNDRIYWKDFLLFIFFPVCIGILLTLQGVSIKTYIGNLIAAIAIFGGFLFNLLAIIYSQIDKIKTDANQENSTIKKRFVKEIHINISYSIVLSLIIIMCLLVCTFKIPGFQYDFIVKKVFIGFTYFLLINFILTLLMVLNRVYILLKKDSE